MKRIKIPEIKAFKTNKIYVQNPDGNFEPREWYGFYSPYIASSSSPGFGKVYEHITFDRDGTPIVREIHLSELTKD